MTSSCHNYKLSLFPLCDHHGALREALRPVRQTGEPAVGTRVDAVLFAWMLSLPATVDAVEAAKAILLVAHSQLGVSATDYQQELMGALKRYVSEEGSVTNLRRPFGQSRSRNQWRLREARRRNITTKNSD